MCEIIGILADFTGIHGIFPLVVSNSFGKWFLKIDDLMIYDDLPMENGVFP